MVLSVNKTELFLKSIFQVSKPGSNDSNNTCDHSIEEQRFAIADGTVDSFYCQLWAKILATGLVATAPFQFLESEQDLIEWLEPMQTTWKKMIEWNESPQVSSNQAEKGVSSSLLGIQILDPEPVSLLPETRPPDVQIRWQAFAIGNCCVFQIRNDHLNYAFPLNRSEQFNEKSSPISSAANKNQQLWRNFHQCEEICYETDLFFLMNSSLAQWFLIEYEAGRKPWSELYYIESQEDFQDFITSLRNSGRMRSTDVTLITFQLGKDDLSISPVAPEQNANITNLTATAPHEAVINLESTPPSAPQKGTTFLVKESSKNKEKKESETTKHKPVTQDVKPPQFSSLDQPSVLKQIGKSIIGLLGKKEDEE